jgi:PKD repeat protein
MNTDANPTPEPTPTPAPQPDVAPLPQPIAPQEPTPVSVTPEVNPIPMPEPLPTPPPLEPESEPEPIQSPETNEVMPPAEPEPVVSDPNESSAETGSQLFLYSFLVTGGVLVFAFYAALLWALWTGNAANPLFETLGIEASGLKDLLLVLTNIIFGGLALTFLISTLVYIFRWLLAKSTDGNKRRLFTRFVVYLTLFICSSGALFFLYYLIDQVSGNTQVAVDNSLIKTVPENVIGLSSPVTIEFDIGTQLSARMQEETIRQINWDFDGDGQYDASGPKVTYRFIDRGDNNGRFPVTAEVFYFSRQENQELSFKSIKEVIINNENVNAVIIAAPESGPFPLEVEFNAAESKDPDGEVIMYEWDLDGDGVFEYRQESPIITEMFTKVGDYKVQLRVTGQNNDTDVAEKIITVKTPESDLKAVITSADAFEGLAPLKISFDGSQSFVKEGVITQYEWFVEGEDEPVLGRRMQRIFREPGDYLVSLTVQNDLGERQRVERKITVIEDDVNAKVEVRTTPESPINGILRGVVPFEVTFDASASRIKEPLEWSWDFDNDGIEDQFGEAVQHVFRRVGTFEVKLEILDSDDITHTSIIPIQVEKAGVTAILIAQPFAGPAPLKVKFDGSASSTDDGVIVNYIWQFPGREPIPYGAQIEYEFPQIGTYPVRMSILTSEGETAFDELLVSARAPIVSADFKLVPTSGSAPMVVQATPEISKGIITEYEWDWGDNSRVITVFGPEAVRHTFREAGVYQVKLRMTDQSGIVSEKIQTIEVR